MSHLLREAFAFMTTRGVILGVALFAITFAGSIGIISFILVKLPSTYFQESHPRQFWVERHPLIRCTGLVAKNLLGVLLVLL
jgi:hypothetical protein